MMAVKGLIRHSRGFRVKCYRLETAPKSTMDGGVFLSFSLSLVVPLSDFARNLSGKRTARAAAAVLIGVRGKQIVLLEWDGMEWNDFAEREDPVHHGML